MKYLFVFLVLGLASSVIGQNRYRLDETNYEAINEAGAEWGLLLLNSTNKPVTGVIYNEGENGRLWSEYNYKDGEIDGLQRHWHENGQLAGEHTWKDGKMVGLSRLWYSDGQLEHENNNKDLTRYWHKNGQLRREIHYKNGDEFSQRDGLCRGWYENGQLDVEYNYKDGEQISKKCWDKEGNETECPNWGW